MSNLLIKASVDYADEFNCQFFFVTTVSEWNVKCRKIEELFEKVGGELEIYFGTNECLIVEDYMDWVRNLRVVEITDEQADFLKKTFGKSWGTGSGYITYIIDTLKERIEEDEG